VQFIYHKDSSQELLKIDGELHNYIFKVRRHDKEKNLYFRNLIDDFLYSYEVEYLDKKIATLHLVSKEEKLLPHLKNFILVGVKLTLKILKKLLHLSMKLVLIR